MTIGIDKTGHRWRKLFSIYLSGIQQNLSFHSSKTSTHAFSFKKLGLIDGLNTRQEFKIDLKDSTIIIK
ncbi:hypothetical protein [Dyadobacter bucti]|uniref:hypothetical protein n=1 Tax=Dyadobacter bucti TaxID=2572203 RepID=UPI001407BBE0|nr:hypothetical protein [Dyadobacter bucti]